MKRKFFKLKKEYFLDGYGYSQEALFIINFVAGRIEKYIFKISIGPGNLRVLEFGLWPSSLN